MSELLPAEVDWEYNGKHYKVCKVDLHIESQICNWVTQEAALALERLAPPTTSPAFYEQQMRLFNTKIFGKKIQWGSEEVDSAVWSVDGKKQLLWLKIMRGAQKGGASIRREDLDKVAEDSDKWQQLVDILYQQDYPDFFTRVVLVERQKVLMEQQKEAKEQQTLAAEPS